jgi:hypothetical protein
MDCGIPMARRENVRERGEEFLSYGKEMGETLKGEGKYIL